MTDFTRSTAIRIADDLKWHGVMGCADLETLLSAAAELTRLDARVCELMQEVSRIVQLHDDGELTDDDIEAARRLVAGEGVEA